MYMYIIHGMINRFTTIFCFAVVTALCACNSGPASGNSAEGDADSTQAADSSAAVIAKPLQPLPDTVYASASDIMFVVDTLDSVSLNLEYLDDPYPGKHGVRTFRGNQLRNADFGGKVSGTPSQIKVAWRFETKFDTTRTKFGQWGGGTGWTGQPLYAEWTDDEMAQFRANSSALTPDFGKREIMVASLCGEIYFINYETGKASRQPLDGGNVIKGTMSLDPELMSLYVGQGVPRTSPFGCQAFDLLTHERFFFFAQDGKAWRGWNAFDSSPIVAGGFLFWAGENGSLHQFQRSKGSLKLVRVLRYRVNGAAPGIESSLCVYRNYGFFADNHGNVVCVNLNTLHPVWLYKNHDDTDATIVCREEGGIPYIYTACEVDKQGDEGTCHIVKLCALNGERQWEQQVRCARKEFPDKTLDGGVYGTPLMGQGDCDSLIYFNICRNSQGESQGEMLALGTADGHISYRIPFKAWAWSSPVGFMNENNEMFVLTGDATGMVYLIRGRSGEVLAREQVGYNFESSPAVVGNTAVVGSRGNGIFKLEIE